VSLPQRRTAPGLIVYSDCGIAPFRAVNCLPQQCLALLDHSLAPSHVALSSVVCIQGRFYVEAGGTCPPDSLAAPRFKS